MRVCRKQLIAFMILVSAGVTVRLMFQDLPNFAPVAALVVGVVAFAFRYPFSFSFASANNSLMYCWQ